MLRVRDLHAYYGKSHILQGVDLDVGENEIVSILGRNGVGRSTTLKAIMGDLEPRGEIGFRDRPIAGRKPHEIAHLGIGLSVVERPTPLRPRMLTISFSPTSRSTPCRMWLLP